MGRRSAVSQARSGSSRTPMIAAVATVAVVAVVIVGGLLWSSGRAPQTDAAIPAQRVEASYPVALRDGVILAGRAGAPHTLDVYEDALCPACRQLESTVGPKIATALDAGRVQVRYHLVNLLEQRSRPAGYSSLGGAAMMCAAENGGFPSVHASLYGAQPEEGGAGYTAAQLTALGSAVGAGPGYADCVTSGRYTRAVADNYARAGSDPRLRSSSGGFATPTIVLDGRKLEGGSTALGPVLG